MKMKEKNDLKKSIFMTDEKNKERFSNKKVVDGIEKAFEAGTGITPATQPDGAALRMEALDPAVYITTWGENDFTIYKDLAKQAVDQTVEKYVVYYSHGKTGHSRFQPEIGIGSVNTPNLEQKTVTMKFIVDTKQQSFAMQMAATTQDTTKILEMSAVADIIKSIEWATFYGDASLSVKAGDDVGLEFDGLTKLIPEENVLDARGKELSPELLNAAAIKIGQGFGVATNAYMPIGVKAAFINKHLAAQRILQPNQAGNGMQVGFDIARFISARGDIELEGSTIMDLDNILDEDAPASTSLLAPTVTAAVGTETGNFLAKDVVDDAGNVVVPSENGKELHYKVVAVGKEDSAPSEDAKVTMSDVTKAVDVTIKATNIGGQTPDYFAVYRQSLVPGDSRYFLIARVPASQLNAQGQVVFHDTDAQIAGTADVFVGEVNPQVISYLEFAPITKFDLAQVTTATQFAVLWYGALALRYPRRWVRLKNVRYATADAVMNFNGK